MSVLDTIVTPPYWSRLHFGNVFLRAQDTGFPALQSLSVFLGEGVVPRSERSDNHNQLGVDLAKYQRVQPGDVVFNKLRTWQGGFGVSRFTGIVSPAYIVCRPTNPDVDPRYVHHLLRSEPYLAELTRLSKWMPPSQFDISWDDIRTLPVALPSVQEQRRIADFLDDQLARIDKIIAARGSQADLVEEARADAARQALEAPEHSSRKPSGLRWLSTIPAGWPMTTVHSAYEVMLGKMLDESRFTGRFATPYLRNTNVQWDRIATDDLKVMDVKPGERERFTLRPGDLLICEGGQPGRSAVWDGSISEVAYQKALHRARPRGGNDVRWLQAFLRVAVAMSVFSAEFGQATIGHLTGEQLRSLRLPMPPPDVQRARADQLTAELNRLDAGQRLLRESALRLEELKRSLITAAVMGEFEVSSAGGSRVPA